MNLCWRRTRHCVNQLVNLLLNYIVAWGKKRLVFVWSKSKNELVEWCGSLTSGRSFQNLKSMMAKFLKWCVFQGWSKWESITPACHHQIITTTKWLNDLYNIVRILWYSTIHESKKQVNLNYENVTSLPMKSLFFVTLKYLCTQHQAHFSQNYLVDL